MRNPTSFGTGFITFVLLHFCSETAASLTAAGSTYQFELTGLCAAGTFSSSGNSPCTSCSAGTYTSITGATACTSCGTGTYSTVVGATTYAECQSCTGGAFTSTLGATSCTSCPAGASCYSYSKTLCVPFTVPAGISTLLVNLYGASSGTCWNNNFAFCGRNIAFGGHVSATLSVTPGQVVYVTVGGQGGNNPAKYGSALGGFNGGGGSPASNYGGAGGGGATDIRTVSCTLASRVAVAGGAGGQGTDYAGGNGGGLVGQDGLSTPSGGNAANNPGYGGSQTAGGGSLAGAAAIGALGQGGSGVVKYATGGDSMAGGGGGGGYWGGGGGGYRGGGGGSSYCGGICSYVANEQGLHLGNGYAVISFPAPTATPTSALPTVNPSAAATNAPTAVTTAGPTAVPTPNPSQVPTNLPTPVPSATPSNQPLPTVNPSAAATNAPTAVTTAGPTAVPTPNPSQVPTNLPTPVPSATPSNQPSPLPTVNPSAAPTPQPSTAPSANPTMRTDAPSPPPTTRPTAPSPEPSALPTSSPTLTPTAPSPLPSVSPTDQHFMYYDSADFLYTSFYNGLHCNGSVIGFSIKSFDLNQCMPSNDPGTNYRPYMHKCYAGAKKVSIVEDTFSDFRCTQMDSKSSKPNGGVIYHGDVCQKVTKGHPGQSAKARCDLLSPRYASLDMVLIQSYLHGGCTGSPTASGQNPEVMALFLNTCTFSLTQDREKFHRVLTYVSGNGYTTDLVLQSARYAHSDKHCSKSPLGELETIVYKAVDGTGICLPDPLLPKRFYKNVLRTASMLQTRPDWVAWPAWSV